MEPIKELGLRNQDKIPDRMKLTKEIKLRFLLDCLLELIDLNQVAGKK
jgi:hypothetical protein